MRTVTALLLAATVGLCATAHTASAQTVNSKVKAKAATNKGIVSCCTRPPDPSPKTKAQGNKPGGSAAAKGLLPAVQKPPAAKQQ